MAPLRRAGFGILCGNRAVEVAVAVLGRRGQLEVEALEVGREGSQLVDGHAGPQCHVADPRHVLGADAQPGVAVLLRHDAGGQQRAGQLAPVRGPDQHRRLALQVADRALRHAAAVGDDDDVVDGLRDLREQVARDEDRLALAGQVPQEAPQPADAFGVQAVRRLVEDDRLGVAEQRGCEAETLTHTHRVPAGPLAGRRRDADQLEHLVDPAIRDPRGGRHHSQVVAATAAGVEVRRLEGGPDLEQGGRDVVVGHAADRGGAGGRPDQAEQHPQRGGLAGPVGAEEAGDASGLDREVEVLDGGEVAEALGEAVYLDARARRRRRCHEDAPRDVMGRSNQRRLGVGSHGGRIPGRFRVRSGSYPRRRRRMRRRRVGGPALPRMDRL